MKLPASVATALVAAVADPKTFRYTGVDAANGDANGDEFGQSVRSPGIGMA